MHAALDRGGYVLYVPLLNSTTMATSAFEPLGSIADEIDRRNRRVSRLELSADVMQQLINDNDQAIDANHMTRVSTVTCRGPSTIAASFFRPVVTSQALLLHANCTLTTTCAVSWKQIEEADEQHELGWFLGWQVVYTSRQNAEHASICY